MGRPARLLRQRRGFFGLPRTVPVVGRDAERRHGALPRGTRHLLELHGRTDRLTCMQCGHTRDRRSFHEELEASNAEWLEAVLQASLESLDMRADGDAAVATENYKAVKIPVCLRCGDGFFKSDVVFFGDSVPAYRVKQCEAAVNACNGLLVVGSSLAVHSAFRHVRAAHKQGIPIAILNVGNTQAEVEGLENIARRPGL